MPRDWKNDPEAIRRYCECGWAVNVHGDFVDEASRVKTYDNPDCPLHGNRPEHDLPPEIP